MYETSIKFKNERIKRKVFTQKDDEWKIFSEKSPDYIENSISESNIREAGYFDFNKVNFLINKLKYGTQVSEIDHMAFIGILSTQLLNTLFVKKSDSLFEKSKNVIFNKIVIDNK